MLEILNRYAHGFVLVPVALALRRAGLFDRLRSRARIRVDEMTAELGANEGHLRAALRFLHAVGWLEGHADAYALAPAAEEERAVPEDLPAVLDLDVETFLRTGAPEGLLRPWTERVARRWGAA